MSAANGHIATHADEADDLSMTLVGLIVVLVVVGVVLWMVNNLIPIDPKIRTIINVIVVLAVCLWLLDAFGLLHGSPVLRVR